MLIFFPSIFDQIRCKQLTDIMLKYHSNKKLTFEGSTKYYRNSYGSSLPEFNALLPDLTPIIKEKTGINNLVTKNSYSRIYFADSILKKHVDRPGLDITLSVCIYDDTGLEWPLHVENTDGNVVPVITKPGDGGLILGTKMNHWRDLLTCGDGKMVIQAFFHWEIPSETSSAEPKQ
jgi:hypothetical protein